jgi:GT2 family glycosyltransferase
MDGISVIIPYYNGSELLRDNLPSVFQALVKTNLKYEVIISDDASTDSPKTMLDKFFPSVVLLINSHNVGFGKNVNNAVKVAKFAVVLILNSDMKIDEDYFKHQISLLKKKDTFSVGGKIIDQSTLSVEAGWRPYIRHGKIRWNPVNSVDNLLIETFYVCGGNTLVSKERFLELGGYLEVYKPFYLEDVDLSIRAWRSGYKCYYSPNSICYHKKSSTIESHYSKREIEISSNKNYLILNYLHSNSFNFWMWKLRVSLQRFMNLFKSEEAISSVFINEFYRQIDAVKGIRKSATYLYGINRIVENFNDNEL